MLTHQRTALVATLTLAAALQALPAAEAQAPGELVNRFAPAWTENDTAAIGARVADGGLARRAGHGRPGRESDVQAGGHLLISRRKGDGASRMLAARVERPDTPTVSATHLVGEFTVSLPETALPPDQLHHAGEWRIRYEKNGVHVVHHGEYEVLAGTHEIRGDRLIHREQTGPYACAVPGTYTWHVAEGHLHFMAVEDPCAARVAVLTSRPWSPSPPSTGCSGR